MRQKDDPMIFPPCTCAIGAFTPLTCPALYEKWCPLCNLVFCLAHHDPKTHNCRGIREKAEREKAQQLKDRAAKPKPKPKKRKRKTS